MCEALALIHFFRILLLTSIFDFSISFVVICSETIDLTFRVIGIKHAGDGECHREMPCKIKMHYVYCVMTGKSFSRWWILMYKSSEKLLLQFPLLTVIIFLFLTVRVTTVLQILMEVVPAEDNVSWTRNMLEDVTRSLTSCFHGALLLSSMSW